MDGSVRRSFEIRLAAHGNFFSECNQNIWKNCKSVMFFLRVDFQGSVIFHQVFELESRF